MSFFGQFKSSRAGQFWHALRKTVLTAPLTTTLAATVNGEAATANFSREGGATVEDFEGIIHVVKTNEARFWKARREVAPAEGLDPDTDYGANVDGVKYFNTDRSGTALTDMRGCLVEEESTNTAYPSVLPTSNTGVLTLLEGSTATSGFSTVDGSTDGVKFVSGGIVDCVYRASLSTPVSTPITVSCYAKAGTSAYASIRILSAGTAFLGLVWFDLSLGTVANTGANITSSSIEDVGDGWYRMSASAVTLSTITNNLVDVGNASTAVDATSVVGETNYFWGLQIEEAGHASTYIPTEASTVTRPAETLTVPRPVLTDAQWNDLSIGVGTYTVSDSANETTAYTLFINTIDNDNNIQILNTDTSYILRKRVAAVDTQVNLTDNYLSKSRTHVAALSSDTGITYKINAINGSNADTTLLLNMTTGDGLVHLATSETGTNHMNAGISNVSITLP